MEQVVVINEVGRVGSYLGKVGTRFDRLFLASNLTRSHYYLPTVSTMH